MRMDLWKCDACGKEYRSVNASISIHVDDWADPVDGHIAPVFRVADLCPICHLRLTESLIKNLPLEERVDLAERLKAR